MSPRVTSSGEPMAGGRRLCTRGGLDMPLPLFLPVYSLNRSLVPLSGWRERFGVEGCITNAYLMYKDRMLRGRFREDGLTLRRLLDFDGLIMTDSGAFQGLARRLYLSNKSIVQFQDEIGADVISPLDVITPPWDPRTEAVWKLEKTIRHIDEASRLTRRSILAGVQQGGRFLDLRQKSLDALVQLGVQYVAIGSLVPFFNRNHNLRFAIEVIRQARHSLGEEIPIHVYGAGDPLELPFLFRAGADIFDSASYGHYAEGGWYMTPYGALRNEDLERVGREYECECLVCVGARGTERVLADPRALADHNLRTILGTIRSLRAIGRGPQLDAWLEEVMTRHQRWFPDSALASSVGP